MHIKKLQNMAQKIEITHKLMKGYNMFINQKTQFVVISIIPKFI